MVTCDMTSFPTLTHQLYIFSGGVSKSLTHFKIRFILLLSFKSSLYILDNSPSSDVSFASIFSPFMAYVLILLINTVFCGMENFNLNKVQFINYFFNALCHEYCI